MNSSFDGLKNAIPSLSEQIKKRKLTQIAADELLGLDQPNVSALVDKKINRFSVEKLMDLVSKVGFDVALHIEGPGVVLEVPVRTAA